MAHRHAEEKRRANEAKQGHKTDKGKTKGKGSKGHKTTGGSSTRRSGLSTTRSGASATSRTESARKLEKANKASMKALEDETKATLHELYQKEKEAENAIVQEEDNFMEIKPVQQEVDQDMLDDWDPRSEVKQRQLYPNMWQTKDILAAKTEDGPNPTLDAALSVAMNLAAIQRQDIERSAKLRRKALLQSAGIQAGQGASFPPSLQQRMDSAHKAHRGRLQTEAEESSPAAQRPSQGGQHPQGAKEAGKTVAAAAAGDREVNERRVATAKHSSAKGPQAAAPVSPIRSGGRDSRTAPSPPPFLLREGSRRTFDHRDVTPAMEDAIVGTLMKVLPRSTSFKVIRSGKVPWDALKALAGPEFSNVEEAVVAAEAPEAEDRPAVLQQQHSLPALKLRKAQGSANDKRKQKNMPVSKVASLVKGLLAEEEEEAEAAGGSEVPKRAGKEDSGSGKPPTASAGLRNTLKADLLIWNFEKLAKPQRKMKRKKRGTKKHKTPFTASASSGAGDKQRKGEGGVASQQPPRVPSLAATAPAATASGDPLEEDAAPSDAATKPRKSVSFANLETAAATSNASAAAKASNAGHAMLLRSLSDAPEELLQGHSDSKLLKMLPPGQRYKHLQQMVSATGRCKLQGVTHSPLLFPSSAVRFR